MPNLARVLPRTRPPSALLNHLPRPRLQPRQAAIPKSYRTSSTRTYSTSPTPRSRADRILSRLPASLQRYTARLRGAPVSHVVAFLILHELTAIVPLLALFGLFHYTDFVPLGWMMEHYGGYVRDGVGRFERYFRRKGWFGFEAAEEEGGLTERPGEREAPGEQGDEAVMERWQSADGKYRIVVEVALAYSITKVMLPVRIVGSLWATPWFAGVLARIRRIMPSRRKV